MGVPRYKARTDGNHKPVVQALRDIGCTVLDLARVGGGCPDLLVAWRGVNVLMEVKDENQPPNKRRLRKNQVDWHRDWLGPVFKVESPREAVRKMQEVTR